MRTKLSLYNSLSALFLQIINLAVNFILPAIIIVEYGSAINGLILSVKQLVVYLSIVEGGLSGAAIYALYKPLADKDRPVINGILSATNRFYNISGFIFSFILLLSIFIYPLFLNEPAVSPLTISLLVLIVGISGVLEFFVVGKYKALLTADQKSYIVSLIQSIAIALNAVIIVILVKLHYNIVMVQAIALLSFFLRSYLYHLYCTKKYKFLSLSTPPQKQSLDKRWDVLFLQILGIITIATPTLVVTFMFGLEEMSVFGIYNLVFTGVLAMISTFSNGLSAAFGDMIVRKQTDNFQKAYLQYEYLFYILLGWAYTCAAILIIPFVSIYAKDYTDANYIRPAMGYLFALSGILFNLKTPQGMLVISAGLYRETRLPTVIQATINLTFSIILAYLFGINGVLLGAIAANLYRTIDLGLFIPKHVTKLPPSISFRRMLRTLLLSFVAVIPPTLFIDLTVSSYLEWFFMAILAGLWCLFVFLFVNILLERKTTYELFIRFKRLLEER